MREGQQEEKGERGEETGHLILFTKHVLLHKAKYPVVYDSIHLCNHVLRGASHSEQCNVLSKQVVLDNMVLEPQKAHISSTKASPNTSCF